MNQGMQLAINHLNDQEEAPIVGELELAGK